MVIIRRRVWRGNIIKGGAYGAVILTLAALTLWGYVRHHENGGHPPPIKPPAPTPPAPARFDDRLAFATDQELLAPPAFPWSLAAVGRLPRAEVSGLRITHKPATTAEAAKAPEKDLAADLAADLTWQAPARARPITRYASPPYLVTPLTINVELELDETGRVATAAVSGAPPDLNGVFAERATAFVFSPAAAGATFAATVKLVPYAFERLNARRGGRPLADDDYRLLFRSLQYSSYPIYDAVNARAPEMLTAGRATTVAFVVDAAGHPSKVRLEPAPEAEADREIAAAFAGIFLPKRVAGARVEVIIAAP